MTEPSKSKAQTTLPKLLKRDIVNLRSGKRHEANEPIKRKYFAPMNEVKISIIDPNNPP